MANNERNAERTPTDVYIDRVVQSATVTADAMMDVMSLETITNAATGELLSKQVVRETVDMTKAGIPLLEEFARAAVAAKENDGNLEFPQEQLIKE